MATHTPRPSPSLHFVVKVAKRDRGRGSVDRGEGLKACGLGRRGGDVVEEVGESNIVALGLE